MGWLCLAAAIHAADKAFGPFRIAEANPDIITMDGEISGVTPLDFCRAVEAAPNARLITLNSPGGLVQMGLLIADDIHQRGISTLIPAGQGCYSACAYIFFAGCDRQIVGELGVHQTTGDKQDSIGTRMIVCDIIDVLHQFDTPIEVMSIMFRTPPGEIHVFSQEKIAELHLNRKGSRPVDPAPSTESNVGTTIATAYAPSSDAVPPIDTLRKQPNRIAVFAWLDFPG